LAVAGSLSRALQFAILFAASCGICLAAGKEQKKTTRESPNALQVVVDVPLNEAVDAVNQTAGDGIIHGTQSYERERNLTGAHPAEKSDAFGLPPANATVIYKVADSVLSPKDFKDSQDMGAITVRYILTPFDAKTTNLRIDAIFIERSSRKIHASDGSVEASEFGEVRHHVEEIQARDVVQKDEEARIARERQEKQSELDLMSRQDAARAKQPISNDLEQRVKELRKKTEVRVSAAGTQLKTAPYQSAAAMQQLPPYTNLLVLIITPYWYGVQTEDGKRGWIHRSEVEAMP
jgi:hypothetical protein